MKGKYIQIDTEISDTVIRPLIPNFNKTGIFSNFLNRIVHF